MAAFTLPAETGQRITAKLQRISQELFSVLDEVREHGGNHIVIAVRRPGTEEELCLVVADPKIKFIPG